jgi:hypothetical protein
MYNLDEYSANKIIAYLKNCGIVKHEYEEKVIYSYLRSLKLDFHNDELKVHEIFSNEVSKPGWGEE